MGAWGTILGLLAGFITGVVTVPLFVWVLWTWGTIDASPSKSPHEVSQLADKEEDAELNEWGAGLGEDLLRELKAKHIPDVASGYFAICREWVPGGVNGKPPERPTPATRVTTAVESPSVYQNMYRSIFDRNKTTGSTIAASPGKSKKTRNVFYVVLRLGHLMLYDDSDQLEVRHVISLTHYSVTIYAGGEDIPEGELWIKRNCIRLTPKETTSTVGDSRSFYLFSDNCSEKEDFYLAMLRSQENHAGLSHGPPSPLKFNSTDLIKLVQQLHASEENLHTRWINALIGRLFLAMYKTKEIEKYIWTKVTKKIARVQKPSLISSVNIQRLDMGNAPPFLTNPKLKELTVDGDLTVEADVSYKGNFRIDISAVARIELGSRFKPREVTFILATILKKLEGHVLIRIKPPPSNRIWVTFEAPPKMDLSLEPIVSSRQITYGVILRAIESRIREVVNDTLVFPNWDDIPFSSTISHPFRGGIWKDEADEEEEPHTDPVIETEEEASSSNAVYSSSTDAARSMPALGSHFLHQRKPIRPDTTNESGESSPVGPPRVLSDYDLYASAADPALSQGSEREQPIVSTGTAAQPQTSHTRRRSSILNDDRGLDTTTQSFDDILATLPSQKDSSQIATATSAAEEARQPGSVAPLERRSTLNKSLNSATTAARKWFAARQNTSSVEDSSQMSASERREKYDDINGPNADTGHHMGPMGRGQPLPPPGTPLPPPSKHNRRRTWSIQTPSALMNLARAPSSAKTPTHPSPHAPSLHSEKSQEELLHTTLESDTSSISQDAPPPLPRRRQRSSLIETNNDISKGQKEEPEEVLVVEAPSQECSAPSSPTPNGPH